MISFRSIDNYKDRDGDFGFVVINDKNRPGHDFKDIFPYVEIDNEIYTTRKVFSNQLHTVKKGTRIIIYTYEIR